MGQGNRLPGFEVGSKASAKFWAMEVICAMAAATALPSKSEGRVIIMR